MKRVFKGFACLYFLTLPTFVMAESCGKEVSGCFYGTLGVGANYINTPGQSSNYSAPSNFSTGAQIGWGYQFFNHLFVELEYYYLGRGKVTNIQPNSLPDARLINHAEMLSVGGYVFGPQSNFNIYGAVGPAFIHAKKHKDILNGTSQFDIETNQLGLGFKGGLQYRSDDSPWFFRLNYTLADSNIHYLGLSASRYIGNGRSSGQVESESVDDSYYNSEEKSVLQDQYVVQEKESCNCDKEEVKLDKEYNESYAYDSYTYDSYTLFNDNIYFDFNSSYFNKESLAELKGIVAMLSKIDLSNAYIHVIGHTDPAGTNDYNDLLSAKRTNRVADFLADNGIDGNRIVKESVGETNPIIIDNNVVHDLSRRVTIQVIEEK